MKAVVWTPKATKQLKKLGDKRVQKTILDATAELINFPAVTGVIALTNHTHGHRLRVGNYRVLFNVLATVEVINIEEVKKRDERTY
jgi:mRNA-degrading endonuclease RelE of RelBE toxin-antitoxin system